jgi:hypothetical protein
MVPGPDIDNVGEAVATTVALTFDEHPFVDPVTEYTLVEIGTTDVVGPFALLLQV